MRKLKKAVSILLSIVLIGSMFTILSVTSASAETVQVFARKWVKAENETGDYYSFTDLYQNFIICRCWPEMDEPSFDYVYNQTENMSLNSHNEIRLSYFTPLLPQGLLCSAFALLILIIILVLEKKNKKAAKA